MADTIAREKLMRIADAFFSRNERILASYREGAGKVFVERLKSLKIPSHQQTRFELHGYPVYKPNLPPVGSLIHKNMLIDGFLHETDPVMQHTMTVAVSYRCSCHCEQCYITEYRDPSRKEMTVKQYNTVFKKAVAETWVWHFDITGGEPFEHPDFFEIIDQIPRDRATAMVATNGFMIDKKTAARIKASNIMICKVSIDAYAGLRSPSVKKALESIELLVKNNVFAFAQIFLKRGFEAHCDLKAIIERCRKTGGALVHLVSPMLIGNLRNRKAFLFTRDERKNIYLLKKYFQEEYAYQVEVFPDWELFSRDRCSAAKGRIYISPYGDMYPCNFIPKPYGNILTDDVKKVIASMQRDIWHPDHCIATNSTLPALKKLWAKVF